jgi:hypothetical protein
MITKYDDTIQRLKVILRDDECKYMNRSTIKGYLGELIVKKNLRVKRCASNTKEINQDTTLT